MIRSLAFRWSGRHLAPLSDEAWRSWTEGARVLAQDLQGLRTMRTRDGAHVVKEFGLRRALSSATLRPYAQRFADHCAEAARRGLSAPEVEGLWKRHEPQVHVVIYRWREGRELREALKGEDAAALMERFGRFMAAMHAAGADFRAGHLGNFLVAADGTIALLDCVDLSFSNRPLSATRRQQALQRSMSRYEEDRALHDAHAAAFAKGYAAGSP